MRPRTPGREDEETIASGTAAAAAGWYCAILAMPNTDPVVDSAATLGALVETAGREADVNVGFLASITRGQRGEERQSQNRGGHRWRRRRAHRIFLSNPERGLYARGDRILPIIVHLS